jgi:hypothetical protein
MASRWWQLPTPPGNLGIGSSASNPPNAMVFSGGVQAPPVRQRRLLGRPLCRGSRFISPPLIQSTSWCR